MKNEKSKRKKRRPFCFGLMTKKTLSVKKKKKRLCAMIERRIGGKSKKSKTSTWPTWPMKEAERPLSMRRRVMMMKKWWWW
jgi:hypothetical protein